PEERRGGIVCLERPVDLHAIPSLGMPDVSDRHVVMPAPEKRHGVETLAPAEHVPSGSLALTLGHDPMFDANVLASPRIRPTRHVAGGKHARYPRFEKLVDDDPAIHGEARTLGQRHRRLHADTDDHEV